jgi:hypothetical protein
MLGHPLITAPLTRLAHATMRFPWSQARQKGAYGIRTSLQIGLFPRRGRQGGQHHPYTPGRRSELLIAPEHDLATHPPSVAAATFHPFPQQSVELAEVVDPVLAARRRPRRTVVGKTGCRPASGASFEDGRLPGGFIEIEVPPPRSPGAWANDLDEERREPINELRRRFRTWASHPPA